MRKSMEHLVFLNVNKKVDLSAIFLITITSISFSRSLGNPLKIGKMYDKNSLMFIQNVVISEIVFK